MSENVVVIGGGVVGLSTAYHLAVAGYATDTVVIEPDPTYEHAATPRSTGGVRVVFCEGLPGGRLAGAVTFPPTGGPVIGLTTRGNRFDSVVYTLLHECAHLTLGHIDEQSGPILDNDDHPRVVEDPREQEANEQASRWLFPTGLNILAAYQDIDAAARQHSVHPSIIAGHIQHEADNWRMLNEYRCNVKSELRAAGLLST